MTRDVVLLDNYDSFSFNLVESFERLGCRVQTFRNTADPARLIELARDDDALIILSPGPGRPEDAGCMMELIALAKGEVPVLGVCLGHQGLVLHAGGSVDRATSPVHGKASLMHHDGAGPFEGMTSPVPIARYHSLCTRDVPARFRVHAQIDGMAMAIGDADALQTGLQFHPESILTPGGDRMLANVLGQAHSPL